MTRRTWNWRAQLTPQERIAIKPYEQAMRAVRAAQDEADKHRLQYVRIMNRAVQRGKYRALSNGAGQ